MKKIKINPLKEKIFNADANSMYNNIDTNHALQVFKPFFIHHPLYHNIWSTATIILEALEILMRNDLSKFGYTYWCQTDGTDMGAPQHLPMLPSTMPSMNFTYWDNVVDT